VFKVHFKKRNKKEGIKSYNSFQFSIQRKHAPFYENRWSLDELDEKFIQKFQSFEILKERVAR